MATTAPARAQTLTIRPMTPAIGAEILDIDLAAPDIAERVPEIRAALLEYGVIFFRDQHLTAQQHIAFARHFGELEIHPATPKDQPDPEILRIAHGPDSKGRENNWHSDVTWREMPSLGSILRAIEVPEVGGDTLFANMHLAFERLSPEMKRFCTGLTAVHDIARVFAKRLKKSPEELHEQYPPMRHPVVRTHPETGKPAIYVNVGFTSHIQGLSENESRWLLDHLFATAADPEIQCRFRWRPGSVAFWDNRVCQHLAASDYFPARRVMERVTIAGCKPFYKAETE
ncbi:Alpha-ketoglutarate-dependent taurine dioxygenase [Tsuneonella dongtanensis]|uniref:Alpha-ketoglutarate-dependent taurine dioxygenase n=1 Tax=Tsuneonella dongtanensis TaxID=692370 RepID=A0A1B2AE12_9SPHN|nr:TauD/TfdA family dioxygenase [Tsuneonella dongtanensis]ANY20377.1 Alpha-ketoglutarate-dependent taurine dioxygenase [Tsuneonella dongtanensis]